MKLVLGMAVIVLCTIGANVLLKVGAMAHESTRVVFGILGWRTIAGLCLYAVAGLLYAWVLRWIPLHMGQVIVAAQFIGVILASRLLLGEHIAPGQWAGIMLILVGILVAGAAWQPR